MPFKRSILATAVLASAALALTACGPKDSGAKGRSSSSASHAAKKVGKKSKKKAKRTNGDCPTIATGHKVIWVNNVEGAMNNIIAKGAKMHCDPKSHAGASYQPIGQLNTYSVASGDTKVTIISKKASTQKTLTAQYGGIAHVKTCADPNGKSYDGGQTKADTGDCWGLNFYDVAVDSNNKITQMTEIYAS
ncbi:hypothetical protein B7755_016685 [Streptomyces sp. NBS 14/10]|uniref:hypothetical protein n=1 Tax=Streptomyces sp. NBS 14/10 TaxID=1945643 RepID=UPI000B7EB5B1|nr:hypothetical protein [Streptomyces sp. NBS 14/10]KAK1179636.1 hypothetical protein B7755_016685 [Streptomyces sp. NBS 14/10]